jgi:DNA processing protein
MQNEALKYQIAIGLIPGIGDKLAKKLIAYTGSPESVFREKKKTLLKIPGIGEILANEIMNNTVLSAAEKEIEFIQKFNIKTFYYLDKNYPERLKQCEDAPIVLFMMGDTNLDEQKIISIVGTRSATSYGKEMCEKLVGGLAEHNHNVLIVSGLAFGIDIAAHKAALAHNLPTAAVVAHGFATIYPTEHQAYARKICKSGALISDFISDVKPERGNFVKRNRIIAGIADATIVVESGEEGGALITADLANSYNREVLAVPGRCNDKYSEGCNKLIKTNRAAIVTSAEDIEYYLGWESNQTQKVPVQQSLFTNLSPEETSLVEILRNQNELPIDLLCMRANLPVNVVSPLLLNLEFAGIVKALPGKVFKLLN